MGENQEWKCPSCGQPVTANHSDRDNVQCPNCMTELPPKSVQQAVKNEIKNLVEAYKEYLKNTEL